MILSDGEIEEAIRQGRILIDPPPTGEQYTSSALDLVLGEEILELKEPSELESQQPDGVEVSFVLDSMRIDLQGFYQQYGKPVARQADGSVFLPRDTFVLGITRERIELPKRSKIAARVEGRSSLARLGLSVHFTAPTIHAGFAGHIVLEMYNFGPYCLRLHPERQHICQVVFERLGRVPRELPRTKWMHQKSIR